jgi:GntR family transcriptional repressor for pyruvate dehydrogenase complex
MTNTAIERRSLNDEIVHRLKELIASGNLKPGDKLATEQELAAQFGVSRLSIREALRALRYLGIVESSQRRGLTVGQLDLGKLGECLEFHAVVSSYPDEQLLNARMAIEVGVLPLVAKKMQRDPAIYDRLYAITARPNVISDPDVYIQADLDFHNALIEAAGVAPLMAFNEVLRAFFTRFRQQALGDRETGTKLHRQIIAALRDQKFIEAQAIVLKSFETYEKESGH